MAARHTARRAVASGGWQLADPGAIDAFATASARLYAEIVSDDPQPWKQQLARAAAGWAAYRHADLPGLRRH